MLFNLSTMLNLKSMWKYLKNTPKPEQKNKNKGSMILQAEFIWEINMGKGLVNLTFAHPSKLTASI